VLYRAVPGLRSMTITGLDHAMLARIVSLWVFGTTLNITV
jgi:hypothetical protein